MNVRTCAAATCLTLLCSAPPRRCGRRHRARSASSSASVPGPGRPRPVPRSELHPGPGDVDEETPAAPRPGRAAPWRQPGRSSTTIPARVGPGRASALPAQVRRRPVPACPAAVPAPRSTSTPSDRGLHHHREDLLHRPRSCRFPRAVSDVPPGERRAVHDRGGQHGRPPIAACSAMASRKSELGVSRRSEHEHEEGVQDTRPVPAGERRNARRTPVPPREGA